MAKLWYLGHSAFYIEGEGIKALIDPFLSENPWKIAKPEDFKDLNYIFVTHAHGDHLGDAIEIAKKTNAVIVSIFEVAQYCQSKGANIHAMHIGGTFNFPFGRVKLVPASHGSSVIEGDKVITLGSPCGVIIEVEGKNVYHAGDTGLIAEMELLGKYENIEIALLPIGGNFTMDIKDAAIASELIKPKVAIPMHFKTWPIIDAEPEDFKTLAEKRGINVQILNPGDEIEF
ncbi:metal-dependent hydrolase [Desulfurobacterium thermolithotrophum]|uniref:metal-dependent hydrolase n=1 Tax=Desulfurobacterium thermolithotrophum TaxID=64160 RepID=UPI0013D170AF|nr:metal-dependent hydrolase [Desulfurobacterium thermolithotrophum]